MDFSRREFDDPQIAADQPRQKFVSRHKIYPKKTRPRAFYASSVCSHRLGADPDIGTAWQWNDHKMNYREELP